jgi:AbiV family abortive infection protein
MTARDEILAAIRVIQTRTGRDDFTIPEVIDELGRQGSSYAPATIRTHVASRMCADAPDHHARVYDGLERVGHGRYRLRTVITAAGPEMAAAEHPAHTWLAVAQACLSNGQELLQDATTLLERHRYPRALSLAVLALEELGKTCQAVAVLTSGGAAEEVGEYELIRTRHEAKITAGLILAAVFDAGEDFSEDFPDRLAALVKGSSSRKMRGFYVDHHESGVRTPEEISEAEAVEAVEITRALGNRLAGLMGALKAEHAAELWKVGPQVSTPLTLALEEAKASPSEAIAAIRDVLTRIQTGDIENSAHVMAK